MSDSQTQNQLKVGVFIAAGLFAILVTILLLGGDKAFFKKHVFLYAELQQTQGLDRGSIVSLAGVVIGNIAEINFSDERKALVVKMKVQEEYLPRITKSALADIRTQGALGDKFIFISPGDAKDPILQNGDFVTTTKTTDIMGMIAEKGNEASKVFDIINEMYKLTKIINADGRSEKLMINFVEVSQNLKATTEETRKLIADLRGQNPAKVKESIEHLNSVLAKLDRGDGTLGALINDPSLHDRLKAIIGADNHKQAVQSLIRTSIQKGD